MEHSDNSYKKVYCVDTTGRFYVSDVATELSKKTAGKYSIQLNLIREHNSKGIRAQDVYSNQDEASDIALEIINEYESETSWFWTRFSLEELKQQINTLMNIINHNLHFLKDCKDKHLLDTLTPSLNIKLDVLNDILDEINKYEQSC